MTAPRPVFSVVTAVYNVEAYLPDFIASIEGQRFDLGRVEVVAVDDGSTDGSLALLREWSRRKPALVTVLTKSNGGQGSARNLGLEHATGDWVTFTDPDDMLDRDFFRTAHRFARSHADVGIMAAKPYLLDETDGRIADTHPRRGQYDAGTRSVDLDREPNTFTGSAAVSLFKRARVRDLGLTFDPRIRPNFEDGHFAMCYLMSLPAPVAGILREARYIYRKRASNDSTLQRSMSDPRRYTDVMEFGYLDILARARARYGSIPAWVQQVLVYELSWYLSEDEKMTSSVRIAPEVIPTFHALLGRIVAQLDPEVVGHHSVRPLKSAWSDVLAHGCRPGDWHSPAAARSKVDRRMGLQRVSYRYVGMAPQERFLDGATLVEPAFSKVKSYAYYGRVLMQERIAWVPDVGRLRLELNDVPVPIGGPWPEPSGRPKMIPSSDLRWLLPRLPASYLAKALGRRASNLVAGRLGPSLRRVARRWPFGARYRDAWVLMDRTHDAGDNGERLFEYLRAERRDINAWFVLEKGTPDWRRMRAAGVRRVVAHGSFRWKMLMLDCSWLLSSHADMAILQPPQIISLVGRPTWRFAFLQHGVIKDDLSPWLNDRDIDMFVVSTTAELGSIVADGTPYQVTAKETRDTGLPRWDRLLAKGRSTSLDDRDLILIAPTWRSWLTLPLSAGSQRRELDAAFWDSEYQQRWAAVLASPRIAEAAARRRWRIGYMPHPNLQSVLSQMALPAHVEPLTFAGNDAQELYARCALLVTDYSSVAFNVAYLDRPVVYFQFDRDEVMGGGHVGRQGYYDYGRDGFGPVADNLETAIAAIVAAIEAGPRPSAEYQARIDRTFTRRDGRACARVTSAVEELSRPYRPPSPQPGP